MCLLTLAPTNQSLNQYRDKFGTLFCLGGKRDEMWEDSGGNLCVVGTMSSCNCQRRSFGEFSEQSTKYFLCPAAVIVAFARYIIISMYIE